MPRKLRVVPEGRVLQPRPLEETSREPLSPAATNRPLVWKRLSISELTEVASVQSRPLTEYMMAELPPAMNLPWPNTTASLALTPDTLVRSQSMPLVDVATKVEGPKLSPTTTKRPSPKATASHSVLGTDSA